MRGVSMKNKIISMTMVSAIALTVCVSTVNAQEVNLLGGKVEAKKVATPMAENKVVKIEENQQAPEMQDSETKTEALVPAVDPVLEEQPAKSEEEINKIEVLPATEDASVKIEENSLNLDEDIPEAVNPSDAPDALVEEDVKEDSPAIKEALPAPEAGEKVAPEVTEDFSSTSLGQEVELPLISQAKELEPAPIQTDLPVQAPPAEKLLGRINKEVFQEMADLERGNAFLNLQMKKEKLKLDLEKLKAEFRQARLKEIETREKVVRDRVEWLQKQEDQKQSILKKEKEIELLTKQSEEAELRKQQLRREAELKRLEDERKKKLEEEARKKRETEEAERKRQAKAEEEARKKKEEMLLGRGIAVDPTTGIEVHSSNSPVTAQTTPKKKEKTKVAHIYRVTEIKGTGGSLMARLSSINEKGPSFLVKKGSHLLTGHTVKSISKDNIVVELDGEQEILGVGVFLPGDDEDDTAKEKTTDSSTPSFKGVRGPRAISFP